MKYYALVIMLLLAGFLCAETAQESYMKIMNLDKEGKYSEAATAVYQFMDANGEDYQWYYAAACYHAKARENKQALKALDRSVELGFMDSKWMQSDKDLLPLHKQKNWKKLITRVEAKRDSLISNLPLSREFKDPIILPQPQLTGNVSVEAALAQRRSVREYDKTPLSLEEISQILWSAYGETLEYPNTKTRIALKTAPSAGGLYPLNIYLAAWDVNGLEPGFYYYEPWGHKLFMVRQGDHRRDLFDAGYYQSCIYDAPASLVYSAVFSRNTDKYGERGRERYVCMDLGHSGENVYLQAEAMGLGTVAIGAFDDLKLRLCVTMTQEEEPLYIMPFGKKLSGEQ